MRIEQSLERVLVDAFPGVPVHSFSDPGEREGRCIGIKAELGAENPIGTNLYDVAIDIESRGMTPGEIQLLTEMVGTASAAKETLSTHSAKQFVMPRGQAVEMIGSPRSVEDQGTRIVNFSLSATIQPI